jgi:hypothetical protein
VTRSPPISPTQLMVPVGPFDVTVPEPGVSTNGVKGGVIETAGRVTVQTADVFAWAGAAASSANAPMAATVAPSALPLRSSVLRM